MNVRERYNAKARQSTAGSHKKKGKRVTGSKKEDLERDTQVDTNADIVELKPQHVKELEREERLRQELASQAGSKMTSKKKRRLEKYIEKKLKKEERVVIFEKLAASQAQVSTLKLQTSSTLGTGKVSTNLERFERQEDKETRRLMDGTAGKGKRKRRRDAYVGGDDSELDDEDDLRLSGVDRDVVKVDLRAAGRGGNSLDEKTQAPTLVMDTSVPGSSVESDPKTASSSTVGSALRRGADGSISVPVIVKKKLKNKSTQRSWKRQRSEAARPPSPVEGSDTSFDSSDSAYDSDSAEEGSQESAGSEDEDEDETSEHDANSASNSLELVEGPSNVPRKKRGFKEWAVKQLSVAKSYVAAPSFNSNSELKQQQSQSHEILDAPDPASPPPNKKRKIDHTSLDSKAGKLIRGPLGEDFHFPRTSLAKQLHNQPSNFTSSGESSTSTRAKRTTFIPINRPPEIEEARMSLPIVAEEQAIMEAILLNPVVIICGETGSGKTTQVPQLLFEKGFGCPGSENPGMIGITQPRRVAAVSMASRVAQELSLPSSRVSYQIRYDASVSSSTSIKFMTDGVLLRELATDFLLTKYSVIIVDEAHERSMNTDILIGVLSRVLKLREQMWIDGKDDIKPLRLIIMSATLRVNDFAENKTLFPTPPPVITVPVRQHAVTIHFSRRTSPDYVSEAIRKASKIHTRLPPGGILIFLTGQNEITGVCRMLEAKFGRKAIEEKDKRRKVKTKAAERKLQSNDAFDNEDQESVVPALADVEAEEMDLGDADPTLATDVDGDMDEEELDSEEEQLLDDERLGDVDETETPMTILPLYSLLPSHKQMRIFEPPPTGSRLVVVATNVAETSLTIPGIRYVIDCGRAKERRYDIGTGIQSFQVSWISKASATQRAGRAGRTGPGHCYRLYSSPVYENYFAQFALPEILRMPIEGVVLQMKSMHIDAVTNFPFPTPPDRTALRAAETLLTHLGALSIISTTGVTGVSTSTSTTNGQITELGKAMALFPLSPRFSRMLVSGRQHGCLPYVVALVSALSVGDPFLHEDLIGREGEDEDDAVSDQRNDETGHTKEAQMTRRRAYFQSLHTHASLGNYTSDMFKILSIVGAYEYAGGGHKFCMQHFVRPKAMEEIHKLRAQVSKIFQTNFPETEPGLILDLPPPSTLQIKVMRQLLCASFIDQVAVRADLIAKDSSTGTKYASSNGVPYKTLANPEDVFIHPTSILSNVPPPDYVVFHEIVRTSRLFIKGITVINPVWLTTLGKSSLCTFSKPMRNSKGVMMVIPRFGPSGWELPPINADQESM